MCDGLARYRQTNYFTSLDALRAASILAVIWHHTGAQVGYAASQWARPLGLGFLGVDMFFVISGFLIVTLLLREKERFGQISLRKFYVRRSLRIFPLYYAVVIGSLVLFLVFRPGTDETGRMVKLFPYYMTYTSNWVPKHGTPLSVAWSLATEEQFYLVWPTLMFLCSRRFALCILAVVIGFSLAMGFGAFDKLFALLYGNVDHMEVLDVTPMPIALGVAAAYLLHSPKTFGAISMVAKRTEVLLASLAALLAMLWLVPADISGWPRLGIQMLMTLLLVCMVIRENHILARVCRWRWLVRIGTVSYGLYLLHMFGARATGPALEKVGLMHPFLFFLACFLATWLAAEVSFRFFETPLLKRKTRYTRVASTSAPERREIDG